MKKDSKPDSLLVEIRCEELPPAVLWSLADSFPDSLLRELQAEGFADSTNSYRAKNERGDAYKKLATPRRLVALLQNIKSESSPREFIRRGPKISAGKDKDGRPTKALVGFMQSVGATCESDLEETEEKYFVWRGKTPGRFLADCLSALVEKVLLSLPAPRRMRWGDNDFKFIRPIRGLLMQHGEKILRGNVMGVPASAHTVGHPTLSPDKIKISSADIYESALCDFGKVQVDLDSRLEMIRKELSKKKLLDGRDGIAIMMDSADEVRHNTAAIVGEKNRVPETSPLLREVAAMCEWPICYWRRIDEDFMSLPQECIAECMKKHQKFLPFIGGHEWFIEKMLRDYCLVADSEPQDTEAMLRGYDSVLRARLRDVQFYYAEDKKIPLADYVERLKTITFHHKLGSQHARIARVCKIAAAIAPMVGIKAKPSEIKQTAEKILAPLPTLMCGEYPQLQEYLSREYFDRDEIFPFVRRCYDLENLAAMFGVGEIPTGSKDPRGLRRVALDVASNFVYTNTDVRDIIAAAVESFDGTIADTHDEIYDFALDRLRFWLSPHYPSMNVFPPATKATIESVVSQKPRRFFQMNQKVAAVQKLMNESAAAAQILIAADKRIKNIFRKSDKDAAAFGAPDSALFLEDAEHELWKTAQTLRTEMDALLQENNFAKALQSLTAAAEPLEKFFNEVMVNADDKKIRANRFALLAQFSVLLNCVADLSFLSSESGG